LFLPYTVTGAFERGILVRTGSNAAALLPSLRREIWAVDRGVAVTLTGTLTDYLRQFSYAEPRFSLVLLTVFAGVGLLLVAIGIYSMVAYTVSRQTHEIGVRIALGAGHGHVLGMVMWMGARLILLGAVIGLAGGLAVTRLLSNQIWGVSAYDPVTIAAVLTVIALSGAAACYFPARRATRVNPIVALRYE
jgi:putative ABC transport system permease protein